MGWQQVGGAVILILALISHKKTTERETGYVLTAQGKPKQPLALCSKEIRVLCCGMCSQMKTYRAGKQNPGESSPTVSLQANPPGLIPILRHSGSHPTFLGRVPFSPGTRELCPFTTETKRKRRRGGAGSVE